MRHEEYGTSEIQKGPRFDFLMKLDFKEMLYLFDCSHYRIHFILQHYFILQ